MLDSAICRKIASISQNLAQNQSQIFEKNAESACGLLRQCYALPRNDEKKHTRFCDSQNLSQKIKQNHRIYRTKTQNLTESRQKSIAEPRPKSITDSAKNTNFAESHLFFIKSALPRHNAIDWRACGGVRFAWDSPC
ncbi:hypothetical protein ACWIUD_04300 [Helicobacter sp. 23-1044]